MAEQKPKDQGTFPVRLDVIDDAGNVIHSCEYVKDKIVLGRILSADLRIDDPRVSRIHGLLEVRGETLLITDLASTHGTFVNGRKIVEAKLKIGDVIKLGFIQLRIEKGSGNVNVSPVPTMAGMSSHDGEETRLDIKIPKPANRGGGDRRSQSAIPDEKRLDDRRSGDRRLDQRKVERRQKETPTKVERRKATERRATREDERRLGQRRRGERRVFDITSLERRIDDRRKRTSDEDILPEELELAFAPPEHARELEVTVLWGDHILDVSNYYDPVIINVGEDATNNYIIPSQGIPHTFPLITIEEDGNAYLAFTRDMTGTVRARDKIYNVQELEDLKFVRKYGDYFILPLRQDDFAKISIGKVSFFILYVKPAPRILPAPVFEKDKLLLRTLIGSFLFMLLFFFGLSFIPEPVPVTIEMIPERFAKIVIKKPKVPPKPKKVATKKRASGSEKSPAKPVKKPEGKAGDKKKPVTKKPPKKLVKKKKTPKKTPVKKVTKSPVRKKSRKRKVVQKEKAKTVGLLKAFQSSSLKKNVNKLLSKDPNFNAFGKNFRTSRGQRSDVVGGAGGQGLKGVKVGGGGKTIGISGPVTKGIGKGGNGKGSGTFGSGRLGSKGEYSVSVISENVQVLSGLPKDVVDAVVRNHRAEIRHCYEAARQRNPNLRGKVVVYFNIQPNGIVSKAGVKQDTVGDRALAGCIVSRVRSWRFPKPEAPVVTEVSAYPFYLNPGN